MANTPLLQPMIDCYRLNRKYFRVPEMGLVTAFWPLTMTGTGETAVQMAGETRFVVDFKVKRVALVRGRQNCVCSGKESIAAA